MRKRGGVSKNAGKLFAVLLSVLALYLVVAAAWAWLAFPEAAAGLPTQGGSLLTARQEEILLRVEDPAFYQHVGLSVDSGQGLATITSSLARAVYLGDTRFNGVSGVFQRVYRSVFDCCKKVDIGRDVMALVLDRKLSKAQQLAAYSRLVYLGSHDGKQLRGFEEAAQSYCGKPLAQLAEREFVGLVAMIKAPNHYHPRKNPESYAQRVAQVEALLAAR